MTNSWLLRNSVNSCGRERFWKAQAVKSATEMDKYNYDQQLAIYLDYLQSYLNL